MKVIYCGEAEASGWDSFLDDAPDASLYHLFAWKEINERSFGHRCFFLAAADGGRIAGVLPIVFVNSRLFGRIMCSMPFVNFGGPCAVDEDVERVLLREAENIVRDNRVDYLEFRTKRALASELPTSEHKVSMTIDLAQDPDVLWNAFEKKHRKEIRHAYKEGIDVRHGGEEYLDTFFEILSESWKNLGTPFYDKAYFRNLFSSLPGKLRIFLAFHGDVPVSAAINGFYKGCVEGMWLGNRSVARGLHPGYVLYWEMIKYACENGYERFHLGRSSVQSGGEFFKKKWNAYPTQLYWQYILGNRKEIPRLNVDNPKYRIAIKAWKIMPASFTRALGPFLSRSIP